MRGTVKKHYRVNVHEISNGDALMSINGNHVKDGTTPEPRNQAGRDRSRSSPDRLQTNDKVVLPNYNLAPPPTPAPTPPISPTKRVSNGLFFTPPPTPTSTPTTTGGESDLKNSDHTSKPR